jgi:predicted alpha/beta hydrolase
VKTIGRFLSGEPSIKLELQGAGRQSDQIGQFFADWAIFCRLGNSYLLKITEVAHKFSVTFSADKVLH